MPSQAIAGTLVLDEWLDPVGEYVVLDSRGRVERVAWGRPPSWAKVRRVEGYIHPAFIDAHMHLSWLGLALYGVDLRGSRSAVEVADRLSKAEGPLAYGRGWDQEDFDDPGRLPDRRLLDSRIPDRPAVAVRVCGHLAVANTLALEEARPWEKYPEHVDRETGLLREDAVYYTIERLLSKVDVASLVARAAEALASAGVGGVASMACNPREAEALARGAGAPLLVACYPRPEHIEASLAVLQGKPGVEVAGVKLFADGSLGARTARLRSGYSDDPGNRGVLLLDRRAIVGLARPVLEAGLRVAVHAIGDEALDEVIAAYEILDPGGQARVEHASIVWPDQLSRLEALKVWIVAQPRFRVSDWWIDRRLGGRARYAYRLRSLHKTGMLALSTDAPVEPYQPWETLQAAQGMCDAPACTGSESLSAREAFYDYTRNAARAAGGPLATAGSLEVGAPGLLAYTPTPPDSYRWEGPSRLIPTHVYTV